MYDIEIVGIPKYQSTIADLNGNGTYKIQHTFVDDMGKKIVITHPRVLNKHEALEVLAGNNSTLFTLEISGEGEN